MRGFKLPVVNDPVKRDGLIWAAGIGRVEVGFTSFLRGSFVLEWGESAGAGGKDCYVDGGTVNFVSSNINNLAIIGRTVGRLPGRSVCCLKSSTEYPCKPEPGRRIVRCA